MLNSHCDCKRAQSLMDQPWPSSNCCRICSINSLARIMKLLLQQTGLGCPQHSTTNAETAGFNKFSIEQSRNCLEKEHTRLQICGGFRRSPGSNQTTMLSSCVLLAQIGRCPLGMETYMETIQIRNQDLKYCRTSNNWLVTFDNGLTLVNTCFMKKT